MKRLINFVRVTAPGSGNGNQFCCLEPIHTASACLVGSGTRLPGRYEHTKGHRPWDGSAVSECFKLTSVVMTLLPSLLPFSPLSLWFQFECSHQIPANAAPCQGDQWPKVFVFLMHTTGNSPQVLMAAQGEQTRSSSGWGCTWLFRAGFVSAHPKDEAMAGRFQARLKPLVC